MRTTPSTADSFSHHHPCKALLTSGFSGFSTGGFINLCFVSNCIMTEGDIDELTQRLAGEGVSAEEMRERLDKTEVTQHEEEALVEITDLFKEMENVEGEERRKTSESIVQAAKRWPEKVAKHSDQLVSFTSDDNYYVRKNATFALGLVGGEEHLSLLNELAKEDDDLEDVARWSMKRIQAEGLPGDQGSDTNEQEVSEGSEAGEKGSEAVETRKIETGSREDETRRTEVSTGEPSEEDEQKHSRSDTVSLGGDGVQDSSSGDGQTEDTGGDSSSRDSSAASDRSASSQDSGGSGSVSPDVSIRNSDGESVERLYREMMLVLYDQGEGHREAVEQAAVKAVSNQGSLQPVVDALAGDGDEAEFAASTIQRISEDDPNSLRDNVSLIADMMRRHDGEVSRRLEKALVNVAKETPESLVEELSRKD